MSGFRFVPDAKGFNDLRNEVSIQKECLTTAQAVASVAGGGLGCACSCDVRPGRTRCHARATANRPGPEAAEALGEAAERLGGEAKGTSKWKQTKKGAWKRR